VYRHLIPGALCLALGACASASPRLATCDGHHRRPANPNGSVLIAPPAAETAAPRAGVRHGSAKPERRAALDPASYIPCRARA
jgi:hypothetical protein